MMARRIVLASIVACSSVAACSDVMACSPSPEARNRPPPPLEQMLSSNPIVFVGVVTSDGALEAKAGANRGIRHATFRIEIPLKGTAGMQTIKIRNRGGGDCYYGFSVGERWLFAGDTDGALYSIWSGSTVLADDKGDIPEGEQSDHQKALRKALPQIAKLPPPEKS